MSIYIPSSLRQLVYNRAKGRCENCLILKTTVLVTHEIDHIIAQKHGGTTEPDNLALSCAICNKYKGSDLASLDPETNRITPLYHPRKDAWLDHFQIQNAQIIPLTSIGRVTTLILRFNKPERVAERKLLIAANLLNFPETP